MNTQKSSKVAVVIVNWNSGDLLSQCVSTLQKQTYPIWQIVIVDNASTDDSLQRVVKNANLDQINIIKLTENVGFAAGNNCALNYLQEADWVALINPDAFAEPSWLENLMTAALQNPQYHFFASRMLTDHNNAILDGVGDTYHTCGFVRRRGYRKTANGNYLSNEEVFSPCAAAALYRNDILKAVRGFDEEYFCYIEDVDLGFRLRLAGYRCLYVANAVVEHVGSAVTGLRSDFSVYHGHRNLVWTYVKNMPGFLFYYYLPQHILFNLVSIFIISKRGQSKTILKAKWDAIKKLPSVWKMRRKIQANRQASVKSIYQVLSKGLTL